MSGWIRESLELTATSKSDIAWIPDNVYYRTMSILSMVATPIGNLEDITYRAVRTLQECDVIACEDTRHTQRLLAKYEIKKRLIACHAHNEEQSARGIVMLLEEGLHVCYVSDAGTPGISDPGARLVAIVREAGFQVVPVPGVSACITLASVAGYTGRSICFDGFLSPKGGKRRTRLEELLSREEAFIVYESPFRIVKLLQDLAALSPGRRVLVGREMTKAYEEFTDATAEEAAKDYAARTSIKGEFAVLVSPPEKTRKSS